jgi:hypothetical protein
MKAITLSAHFDGKQIVLDEPFELATNTRLIVTVLSDQRVSDERESWLQLSRSGLERAYNENEVEYTLDMTKWPNPNYDKGDVVLTPIPQVAGRIKN